MKTAVDDWHKRLFDEEKKKDPEKYPEMVQSKIPSPGPGQYVTSKGPISRKTF